MITLDSELIGKVDSSVADTLLSKKLKILVRFSSVETTFQLLLIYLNYFFFQYKSKPDNVEIHLKHKAKGKSSGVNSFRRKQLIKESNKKVIFSLHNFCIFFLFVVLNKLYIY